MPTPANALPVPLAASVPTLPQRLKCHPMLPCHRLSASVFNSMASDQWWGGQDFPLSTDTFRGSLFLWWPSMKVHRNCVNLERHCLISFLSILWPQPAYPPCQCLACFPWRLQCQPSPSGLIATPCYPAIASVPRPPPIGFSATLSLPCLLPSRRLQCQPSPAA